jgi:hypothetical protein
VAVRLAFDTILERIRCFGQQANDLEARPFRVFLMPIRRKGDCLTNRELVGPHLTSPKHSLRRRPGKGSAGHCPALLRLKRNRGRLALLAALQLVAELLALVQIANPGLFDG